MGKRKRGRGKRSNKPHGYRSEPDSRKRTALRKMSKEHGASISQGGEPPASVTTVHEGGVDPLFDALTMSKASAADVLSEGKANATTRIHTDGMHEGIKVPLAERTKLAAQQLDPQYRTFIQQLSDDGFPRKVVGGELIPAKDAQRVLQGMVGGFGHYSAQCQSSFDLGVARTAERMLASSDEEIRSKGDVLQKILLKGLLNCCTYSGVDINFDATVDAPAGSSAVQTFLKNKGTLGLGGDVGRHTIGMSTPINMSGGKFTKINPDFCGPGASEFLRQHDFTGGGSETEMLSSALLKEPLLNPYVHTIPLGIRAPEEFDGYKTFVNVLNNCPEQIAPPDHYIHHLLPQAQRFVYPQAPEDFLPDAFDGKRFTPAYMDCIDAQKDEFFLPNEVCCLEDRSSFMLLIGGGFERGFASYIYFIDIQPHYPEVSMPVYSEEMNKYVLEARTQNSNAVSKGEAVVTIGVMSNLGQFVGKGINCDIVINRRFTVSQKGRLVMDFLDGTGDLFNPSIKGKYEHVAKAMANNVWTAIEEVIFLNNRCVTPRQHRETKTRPPDSHRNGDKNKNRKKRANPKKEVTVLIDPGFFADNLKYSGMGTGVAKKPHFRRGHLMNLQHERYARSGKQGKSVWRRPTWVGAEEGTLTDLCPTLKGDRHYIIDVLGRPDHPLEED